MSSDVAIKVDRLSKCYQIYDSPRARLKQFVMPRVHRLLSRSSPRYYREFWALKDVSFEVLKGETVGIIGRNGSGKSTLLQLICGTLSQTSGTIHYAGRIAALLELGSGFNPEFTGRENVYMNASVLGLSRDEIDARYDDIVAFSELGDFVEQPVKTYSSGMLVRLAFSVAINVDPEILVVDEALSVGDELFQRKCFSRIEAIRSRGATILFVSHSGGQIVELCDRAILLDSGEKLAMGPPKQIVGRYQKLLYAPAERRESVKELIRISDVDAAEFSRSAVGGGQQYAFDDAEQCEAFDSNLKSTSTIEYESHGARIESPVIRTLSGELVNSLVRGRVYRYCYSVTFSVAANDVRFGMLIKTVSGVELGGGVSAASMGDGLAVVGAGESYSVEFRFRCMLNQGTYFLNAGVVGSLNGDETYLHRLVDIAIFKVVPGSGALGTGIVDFDCVPEVGLIAQ